MWAVNSKCVEANAEGAKPIFGFGYLKVSFEILRIDGMTMSVYDDKSDHDNPFVEPLFDLIIHKAKVTKSDSFQLFVKTKVMYFWIETNSEVCSFYLVYTGTLFLLVY